MHFKIFSSLIALMLLTGPAHGAGPWPREPGEKLLIPAYTYSEFNQSGSGVDYAFSKREVSLYFERGLTRRITFISRLAAQDFQDEPDPDPDFDPPAFSNLGGSKVGLRFNLFQRDRWAGAVEAHYHFDTPSRVGQDLDAGGGEDGEVRLSLGRSFAERGFGDVQIAWRERGDFNGSEVHFDTTIGVPLWSKTRLLAQTYSVWSDGETDFFISDYQGHRVQLSLQYNVMQNWAVQAGWLTTLHADGIAEENAAMISLWRTWR